MTELLIRQRFVNCANERIMYNTGWEMKQDCPTSQQGEMKENEGKTNTDQSSRRQERVKGKSKWESMIHKKHNIMHMRKSPISTRSWWTLPFLSLGGLNRFQRFLGRRLKGPSLELWIEGPCDLIQCANVRFLHWGVSSDASAEIPWVLPWPLWTCFPKSLPHSSVGFYM